MRLLGCTLQTTRGRILGTPPARVFYHLETDTLWQLPEDRPEPHMYEHKENTFPPPVELEADRLAHDWGVKKVIAVPDLWLTLRGEKWSKAPKSR